MEARDLTEYKVALIEENIERSGLDNIEAVCQDATINDEASYEKADILIADLPCSGLGILGKKPDLKSKMTVEIAKGLADLQRQILTVVHNYVKPGGKLLYSTCTINREENEDNTAWFVENFPEFEKIRENEYYNALQLKFAYAVTCHKAQGGQWDAVFIDQGWLPEEMLNDEYWRWLYTAITRAQERVYFVNFKEEFFEIPV